MCEKSSKSKSINRLDALLSKLDLTRKGIVKNDSCIFRAVSERLFNTQVFHEHVKKTCLDYLSRHVDDYQPFIQESIKERIKLLEENKTAAGQLEMIVISKIYRLEVILFLPSPFGRFNLTQNDFNKQISLCYMENDHYDLVYSKTYTNVAAFCQSILYELLYKEVFGLHSEIEEAVIFLHLQKHLTKDVTTDEFALADAVSFFGHDKVPILERIIGRSAPPLPYRVAKALHPALYRNVELDIIHEELREERFRKQAYLRKFVPGDKCQVFLGDSDDERKSYHGHIQELDQRGETVVVYIEELTVKKTLPTSCVKPLPLQLPPTGNHAVLPVAEIATQNTQNRPVRREYILSDKDKAVLMARYSFTPESSEAMPIALTADTNVNSTSSVLTASLSASSSSQYSDRAQTPNRTEKRGTGRAFSKENAHPQDAGRQCFTSLNYIEQRNWFIESAGGPGQYSDSNTPNAIAALPPCAPTVQPACSSLGQSSVLEPLDYQVINVGLAGPPPAAFTSCTPIPFEESCIVPTGLDPYFCAIAPDMSQPAPSQGPMYLMPVVAVPYASNMGHVNMNWTPSQDPYGKDLPLSDINTLRFFFNLGVEYYRLSSCGQQPSTNYGAGLMYIPPAIPEVSASSATLQEINANTYTVPTGIYTDTSAPRDPGAAYVASDSQGIETSLSSGESASKSAYSGSLKPVVGGKGNVKCSKMNDEGKNTIIANKLGQNDSSSARGEYCQIEKSEEIVEKKGERGDDNKEKEKSVDGEDSGSDHMDVGSDGDSGCPSECADLSPINGTDAEFVASDSTSNAGDNSGVPENGKPKGKRRYYMYGNHKLIKPIKEIPLRFQMLLAETSAAKARCEGQPIYMQQPPQVQQPSYDIVYYHSPEGSQPQQTQSLNANASCFVPNQNGDCGTISYAVPDEYSVCPISNFSGNPSSTTLQPAPLFVPPPPPTMLNQSLSNSSQQCSTIIMYSGASTATSYPQNIQSSPVCTPSSQTLPQAQPLSVPPPFPPPSSIPPPSVDTSPVNYPPTITQLKPAFPINPTPCPSPLTAKSGPPTNPPQGAVMYMVSPAYPTTNYPSPAFQQQGLIMPSVATQ